MRTRTHTKHTRFRCCLQLVAVLAALTDVIRNQALPLTPTSFFAAAMSALEKPDTRSSAQVSNCYQTVHN